METILVAEVKGTRVGVQSGGEGPGERDQGNERYGVFCFVQLVRRVAPNESGGLPISPPESSWLAREAKFDI